MITYTKKVSAIAFLLFLGLFAAGFIRTFTLAESDPEVFVPPRVLSGPSYEGENRAGIKVGNNLKQIGLTQAPLPQVLDQEDLNKVQVYEKTAQLSSGTTTFTDDESRIRGANASNKAIVFNERAAGIAPHRSLSLGINVHPERFDALLEELSAIGQLHSINVQLLDRTGDFRRLDAQRQSLKKHLDFVMKLRDAGKLEVDEALKLEQKVVDIEKESQAVGVQLGDLLNKEPSYNLFLTLQEFRPGSWNDRSFTFARRMGDGFLWAFR